MGPQRLPRDQTASPDAVLRIIYDGETSELPLPLREVPAHVDRELWLASNGVTVGAILESIDNARIAPFMMAPLLFAAKRCAGEKVDYLKLEESLDEELLESIEFVDLKDDEAPKA